MDNLWDTLFGTKCLFCPSNKGLFCKECLKELQVLEKPFYYVDNLEKNHKLQVISCFEYEGLARECILKAKYGSRYFYALNIMANYGAEYVKALGIKTKNTIFVPIPSSQTGFKKRGFNQAETIAQIFAHTLGGRLDTKLLLRVKDTPPQHSRNRQERFSNVENAFKCDAKTTNYILKQQPTIYLVDDICTSGATLLESKKALWACGMGKAQIIGLSLCQTLTKV